MNLNKLNLLNYIPARIFWFDCLCCCIHVLLFGESKRLPWRQCWKWITDKKLEIR